MKFAILAAIVAAATTVPTVAAATADDPFGDTPIGHGPFQSIFLEIGGILDTSSDPGQTCTYELATPFSVERQIGHAGPVWTISGTTTDTFVASWESPIHITTIQTEEGEPIVTSCINQHGQEINLYNPNCQVPEP